MTRKGSAFSRAAEHAKNSKQKPARATPLHDRFTRIEEARQAVRTNTLRVDPSTCRLWSRHNRKFDRLNETNCRDLIESFISAGRQEIPAIVRPATNDAEATYEIICGARRFWTVRWLRANNYPEFEYLIEVRTLSDEEAFRLSNLENLDRSDISDYERALDYAQALQAYYGNVKGRMAERLNKSPSWLSRYLRLARLPVSIADAYAQWADLKLHHAQELLSVLNDPKRAPALLELAGALKAQHRANAEEGATPMSGPAVLRQLTTVASAPSLANRPVRTYGPADQPHLTLKRANRYGLTLHVSKGSGASVDDIVASLQACLREYYQ